MSDYPTSATCQVISRSLKYYGYCKCFTRLVDTYDRKSFHDCSLIVPYQIVESPGGNVLFQLDKHARAITSGCTGGGAEDAFFFTLSDKFFAYNMAIFVDMGEIPMPPNFVTDTGSITIQLYLRCHN